MNAKSSSNIKEYFTSDAWTALSEYEKRRYENVMKNYEFMNSKGITAKVPEFMINKFKRSMPKNNKTNDRQFKKIQEPKAKFKHFAVSKPAVTKLKKPRKGVFSTVPVVTDTEPPTAKTMTSLEIHLGVHKRKELTNIILNSAQSALKDLKDMCGDMEEFEDDMLFFDAEINLSEPDTFIDFLEEHEKEKKLFKEEISFSLPGTSKGIQQKMRYPKRSVPKKSYKEEDVSSEDEFLYCDICNEEHKGSCPVHGPMLLVCDKKIPKGDSDRAKRTLPHFFSIGISTIPGAGLGVWTDMPLVPGMVFGPYEGSVIKKNEDAKKSGYAWQVRKQSKSYHYIEGADKSSSNWMRYVNCANHEEWQNVVAFQYLGMIYYRTYKPVLPYTEILVWYGDDYGSELGIQVKKTKCLLPPKDVTGFPCDVCNHLFSSSENLKRHRKIHPRMQNEKRHRCPECFYSTDYICHLRKHLLTHSGEKPHACPHCPKRFTQKCNLHMHILLHTGEKEHICSTCDKRFTQKGTLVEHERVHSGEKPYRCPDCGKDFTQSSDLKKHIRLHTRQRPYPCPHCERRFSMSGHLTRHISSIHTRVFPHNCSLCGKGFHTPGELKKHVERQHDETEK